MSRRTGQRKSGRQKELYPPRGKKRFISRNKMVDGFRILVLLSCPGCLASRLTSSAACGPSRPLGRTPASPLSEPPRLAAAFPTPYLNGRLTDARSTLSVPPDAPSPHHPASVFLQVWKNSPHFSASVGLFNLFNPFRFYPPACLKWGALLIKGCLEVGGG